MGRAVIIIHPSEIIRRGLSTIFEEQPGLKIFCKSDLSLVKTEKLESVHRLILIVPVNCKHNERLLELRTAIADHLFIGLSDHIQAVVNNSFDHTIPIETPISQITTITHRFLTGSELELNEELTNREKEILRLIAHGKTNKAIADTLFISTHTVISHRKNITEKLGIKSIPGLTVYAIIQKIIDLSDISPEQII